MKHFCILLLFATGLFWETVFAQDTVENDSTLKESNKNEALEETDYLFGIGGSVDLLDDIIASTYFSIDVLVPNIIGINKNKAIIGLRGGFF